ncbi:MAG: hypothetical protein ACYC6M_02020 [Terriglobales bacterium]
MASPPSPTIRNPERRAAVRRAVLFDTPVEVIADPLANLASLEN